MLAGGFERKHMALSLPKMFVAAETDSIEAADRTGQHGYASQFHFRQLTV